MIKAVLFDLDGTVADTNTLIFESFKYTFAEHGIENVLDEDIYAFFGEPLALSMERYTTKELAPRLVETYRSFNEVKHDEMIADFPEVVSTLQALAGRGIKLGIVTSKREAMARRSLQTLNLLDYFDVLVTPELTEKHKPDKAPVEKGIALCGVLPEECIMVGDSPYDILSGNAAGSYTAAVMYTVLPKAALAAAKPDFFIHGLGELFGIIDRINSPAMDER